MSTILLAPSTVAQLRLLTLGGAPLASGQSSWQFFQLFYRRRQGLPEKNEYKKKIDNKQIFNPFGKKDIDI
jgi:hypothetical protein